MEKVAGIACVSIYHRLRLSRGLTASSDRPMACHEHSTGKREATQPLNLTLRKGRNHA